MAVTDDNVRIGTRGVFMPLALAGAVLTGTWFAAQLHSQVQTLEGRVAALERRVDGTTDASTAIDKRLARLEVLMETIIARLPREERPAGPR